MSFVEFIGLIVSLIFLALISARQAREERKRRAHPELWEKEQAKNQQSLREMFRSMHIEIEEDRKGAPTYPISHELDLEEEQEAPRASRRLAPPPPKPPRVAAAPRSRLQVANQKPPRMVKADYGLQDSLDRFQQVRPIDQQRLSSAIDKRRIGRQVVSADMMGGDVHGGAYSLERAPSLSRAAVLVRCLHTPRDMLVYRELMGSPKGLAPPMLRSGP